MTQAAQPKRIEQYRLVVSDSWIEREHDELVIVRKNDIDHYAVLQCPCGCGDCLRLNMLPSSRPCWSADVHGDTVSLSPSILRKSGCKSHFWIRLGRVGWC